MTTLVDTEAISASTDPGPATSRDTSNQSAPWIYSPWLDLLVGCGAWSAPLLAVAMWMAPSHTHAWVVAFYALALVFNYPHFMATIYRAYHTRENFEKYKFFTLHITLLLALTAILMHASPRLFPWVFTLYICWSPWHYSGQNYGLLMMFARRSGAEVTPSERRWLRAAFIASYVMLLASFETGGSNDPLILSLGIPAAAKSPHSRTFAPAFAIGAAALLFLWGGLDQIHFALSNNDRDLSSLQRAADMNPYDSALNARIGLAEAKAGNRDEAVAALAQAVDLNPANIGVRQAYARALLEAGRYDDAYSLYKKTLETFPRDVDSLVNFGLLAARLGNPDQAIDSWQKAVDVNPNETNAHMYLAQAFDQTGEPASAARHWEIYLRLASSQPENSPAIAKEQIISATIQLADDESAINRSDAALVCYQSAIALAQSANNPKLEALVLAHLADLQDKRNDAAAAQSFQRALALDAKSGDRLAEGSDWFNYGQFLRRHQLPKDLAYACLLRAEELLATAGPAQLQAVQTARRQLESELGKKAPAAQKDLPALLARATNLPAGAL